MLENMFESELDDKEINEIYYGIKGFKKTPKEQKDYCTKNIYNPKSD